MGYKQFVLVSKKASFHLVKIVFYRPKQFVLVLCKRIMAVTTQMYPFFEPFAPGTVVGPCPWLRLRIRLPVIGVWGSFIGSSGWRSLFLRLV